MNGLDQSSYGLAQPTHASRNEAVLRHGLLGIKRQFVCGGPAHLKRRSKLECDLSAL
jgi:hypothetical protein